MLSAEVVVGKKKELLELGDTEATRRLVQAFRKGAEASKGGSAVAFQVSGAGRRGRSTGDGAWLTSGGRARETRLITVCCLHAIVAAGCR